MNWRRVGWFVFLLGLPAAAALGANQNFLATFQKANTAYTEGKYPEASTLYESLISKGWKHSSVFYNLGNACFKQNRLGLAILYYEKAKRLSPRNRQVTADLEYVRGLLEYRIEDKRNWYFKAGERLLRSYTEAELGITSLALAFVFLASWAFSLYFGERGPWGWKRKTLLVVTLLCLALWGLKGLYENRIQDAVVLKAQAPIRYGPSYKDRVAFRLSEGMEVQVNGREGDWSRVALLNGETGWMAQEDLGVV